MLYQNTRRKHTTFHLGFIYFSKYRDKKEKKNQLKPPSKPSSKWKKKKVKKRQRLKQLPISRVNRRTNVKQANTNLETFIQQYVKRENLYMYKIKAENNVQNRLKIKA